MSCQQNYAQPGAIWVPVYVDSMAMTGVWTSAMLGVPEVSYAAPRRAGFSDPFEIANDVEQCRKVMVKLEKGIDHEHNLELTQWLIPAVREFCRSPEGSRIVQKILETQGRNSASRNRDIAKHLQADILEVIRSPHGNHVVQKMVEIMPPAHLDFVIQAINVEPETILRNRFGCRIIERLIENCSEEQMSPVFDVIVHQAETLSKHSFGNYVVSSLVEHGSRGRQVSILDQLLPSLPTKLATHHSASHVVQKLINCCDEDAKQRLMKTVLSEQNSHLILGIACSPCGSAVIQDLAEKVNGGKQAIRPHLEKSVCDLKQSTIDCFGLVISEVVPESSQALVRSDLEVAPEGSMVGGPHKPLPYLPGKTPWSSHRGKAPWRAHRGDIAAQR